MLFPEERSKEILRLLFLSLLFSLYRVTLYNSSIQLICCYSTAPEVNLTFPYYCHTQSGIESIQKKIEEGNKINFITTQQRNCLLAVDCARKPEKYGLIFKECVETHRVAIAANGSS